MHDCFERFGLELADDAIVQVISCENKPWKQQLIMEKLKPQALFSDVRDMGGFTAYDLISQDYIIIPSPDMLWVGWMCTKHSVLFSGREGFLRCLDLGEGASGETFKGVEMFLQEQRPRIIILENATPTGFGTFDF